MQAFQYVFGSEAPPAAATSGAAQPAGVHARLSLGGVQDALRAATQAFIGHTVRDTFPPTTRLT